MKHPRLAAAILATLLPAAAALAQQAPQQQQVQPSNGDARVNTRVGGELYGNNYAPYRPTPYQTQLLPSEERYAIWRSGVLPSELQFYRNAVGPLVPNGVLNYLPPRSPLQRAMGLPAPRLYNPGYVATQGQGFDIDPGPDARAGGSTLWDVPGAAEQRDARREGGPLAPGSEPLVNGRPMSAGQLANGPIDARVRPIPPVNTADIAPYPDTWMHRRVARPTGPQPATQPAATQPTTRPYDENK